MDKTAKDIMAAMQDATTTIFLVQQTILLVNALIKLGDNAANIPALMTHNEYLMQSTVQSLQRALVTAKEQVAATATATATAKHPDIQLLEQTLAHMQHSLGLF